MDAADWDDRYTARDLVWGVAPNRFVADALAELPPGRALDVACGEGRNALWLAARGWTATGVDFSPVAVERARRLAERTGVSERAGFAVLDVTRGGLPAGPYDAVVVAYLHLAAAPRRRVLRGAADVVAPGGRLVVVAHDLSNLEDGTGGPQDPAVLFSPQDVVTDLAGTGLDVERAEVARRPVETPDGPVDARDALVVARRREQR
jgi:SAM-dependent methyltransferase